MNAEALTISVESATGESTVEAPRRVAVKGLSRLATYLRGKEILILGPGSVGKTKFAQYLQLATLDPEGKREMTYAVTRSRAFVVAFGQDEGLELKVRRTVDTPGQVGPLQHALMVARRKPHAVIVVLDCGADPLSMLRWLCLFCNALDTVLRKVPFVVRRLQEMVVVLNKRDKINDKEFAKLHQASRKVLERYLTVVWGEKRVASIPILECISVRTGCGTALIDDVITRLMERLAGRQAQRAAAGPRVVAVSPAGPRPGAPRPSCRTAATPSSPAVGRQVQQGPALDPTRVAASPAGARPGLSRPLRRPAPTPSTPLRQFRGHPENAGPSRQTPVDEEGTQPRSPKPS